MYGVSSTEMNFGPYFCCLKYHLFCLILFIYVSEVYFDMLHYLQIVMGPPCAHVVV